MSLAKYATSGKTHDPVRQIAAILREETLPEEIRLVLQQMLPDLLALGQREHILTDYGDEETYTLPWELFTQPSAEDALQTARRCVQAVQDLLTSVEAWRRSQGKEIKR